MSACSWMVDWRMARIGEQGVRPGYLRASWWMVDSCMARVGKQRMRPGCSEHKLLEYLLADGGFVHGENW